MPLQDVLFFIKLPVLLLMEPPLLLKEPPSSMSVDVVTGVGLAVLGRAVVDSVERTVVVVAVVVVVVDVLVVVVVVEGVLVVVDAEVVTVGCLISVNKYEYKNVRLQCNMTYHCCYQSFFLAGSIYHGILVTIKNKRMDFMGLYPLK